MLTETSSNVFRYSNKRSNMNLQDFNAKLSDFGLAREGPVGNKTHVTTRILGTEGYAAPEYLMTGKTHDAKLHKQYYLAKLLF